MHLLWPDDMWEIIAERTTRRGPHNAPTKETRRVALFTSFDKANDYLNACTLQYPRRTGKFSELLSVFLGTDPHDQRMFDPASPLADFQRAWIVKATVLPIDPDPVGS